MTTQETVFLCHAGDAQSVYLAGTFNEWDPERTAMEPQGEGLWRTEIQLPTGRHEYKFVVDGQWCCEPGREDAEVEGCIQGCIPNPFGSSNRVIEVLTEEESDCPAPESGSTGAAGITV